MGTAVVLLLFMMTRLVVVATVMAPATTKAAATWVPTVAPAIVEVALPNNPPAKIPALDTPVPPAAATPVAAD